LAKLAAFIFSMMALRFSALANCSCSSHYQLFSCIECGCCDVVCPSHIPLVQQFRVTKGEIITKEKQAVQSNLAISATNTRHFSWLIFLLIAGHS
jgi:Na+-translocating ferredoxin:NAD+ oxidoreductase RnfC subunit